MVRTKGCLLLLLLALSAKAENERKGKLFSLFSVVSFENVQCTAASNSASERVLGICQTKSECTDSNGKADGNCASGFGVCCTHTVSTCGDTIRENCTYVQNPSYPSAFTTATSCAYNVQPMSSNICQLRLDFETFDLAETTAGVCTDTFKVTMGSTGRKYYDLCGTLTGQHIYLETGRSTSSQMLTFTRDAASMTTKWRFAVKQIECSSKMKAPSDCFQYFTGTTGSVSSLNYPTVLLATMTYDICVRREVGFCGIQWSQKMGSTTDTFVLDKDTTTADNGALGNVDAYLAIPGTHWTNYGGNLLNNGVDADTDMGAVTAAGVPFRITYVGGTIQADDLGFDIEYTQIPCGAQVDRVPVTASS